MSGHKWSASQRRKYSRTMQMRKNGGVKPTIIKQSSHFYRLKGTELIPVKVKKIVAWVIE